MIVDRKELSRQLGISVSRIMQLAREGIFTRVSRGRYDVAQCLNAYIDFRIQAVQNRSGTSDVVEARKRLFDAQTHKVELETERTRRETVSAADHLESMLAVQQIFNTAMDGIDNTLAHDIAGLDDAAAIADRLTQATNAVREIVADNIVAYSKTLK